MSFILMAEVMKIDNINDPLSKWLLLVLADYASDDTRTCFPSLTTISKRSCIRKTTLQKRLRWLEDNEYINRTSGNSYASNIYTVIPNLCREATYVGREPTPNLSSNHMTKKVSKNKKGLIDLDWKPSQEILDKINDKFGEIDHAKETDKFVNYHVAKGSVFAKAERAYYNWCRNASEWGAKIVSIENFKNGRGSSTNGHSSGYFASVIDNLDSDN